MECLRSIEWNPRIPHLALQVKCDDPEPVNGIVGALVKYGFHVQMVPCANLANQMLLILSLDIALLEREAAYIQLEVKVLDLDLKQPFEPTQRTKFEPFRSKDIQTLILSIIRRLLDFRQLVKTGLIAKVVPLHDCYGLHQIQKEWGSIFMPVSMFPDFVSESSELTYPELSSIKNYFGEKEGSYFAFMAYYTTWLVIPGIIGLGLTIYQLATSRFESVWIGVYALIVSLWVTVMIEMWKRKLSALALKWGVFHHLGEDDQFIRQDYVGDEYFSRVNHEVDKKSRSVRGFLIFIVSLPILLILMGACVLVYVYTKQY